MSTQRVAFRTALAVLVLAASVLATAGPATAQFVNSPPLAKFAQELRGAGGPTGIPVAQPDGIIKYKGLVWADHYTIDMNQYTDTLHPALAPTTLWGYNPRNALGVVGTPVQKHLGGILVGQRGKPIQVSFFNNLPSVHPLPVDHTLMGAMGTPDNRTAVHVHGGFNPWFSDGIATAWWEPLGTTGASFVNNAALLPGKVVPTNQAEYYYTNDQSARMMWYHDHADGITRLNAYAGLATAYLVRDTYESNVLIKQLGLPGLLEKGGRELPIVFQDKIFLPANDPTYPGGAKTAGSLWYPFIYDPARWTYMPPAGAPPLPVPSVVAESFGDTMLVNGTVYPNATVDPRRYRLRILNACQARFLNLQLYEDDGTGKPNFAKPGPDFLVIGTESGFLARPAVVPSRPIISVTDPVMGTRTVDPAAPGGSLITAPAERWDVVVDFNGKGGKKYILWNDAPAPYPMGALVNDYPTAGGVGDTQTLMRFAVRVDGPAIPVDPKLRINAQLPMAGDRFSGVDRPLAGANPAATAASLSWNSITTAPLPIPTRAGITVRQVTLNETFDAYGRLAQLQGNNIAPVTVGAFGRAFLDAPTEVVTAGSTEVWQIVNLTADTHPIHTHLASAQILSRRPFDVAAYMATPVGTPATITYPPGSVARGPDAAELGWKETFKANPGEVTTFIINFTLPKTPFVVPPSPRTGGFEYMWHCHILDHEEHDMMRPLVVMP